MMDSINITRASSHEDVTAIASLAGIIWRDYFPGIITPEQVEYMIGKYQSVEAITRQIERESLAYYLLEVAGERVGYFAIRRDDDGIFLSKLYVRGDRRGRGLARAAVGWIVCEARAADLARVWLTTNKRNDVAVAAYTKLGFITVDSACTDIGSGYVMDDYIMELRV